MATTATAQDDDLLIIADDNATDDSSDNIEFSFDFDEDVSKTQEAKVEETSTTQEVDTSLDSLLPEEGKIEDSEKSASEVKASTEGEMDLGINLETDGTESESEAKVEDLAATQEEDFSFDLGGASGDVTSEVVGGDDSSSGSDDSMNAILSGTIAKLTARQDAIATDKSTKTSKEEDLKTQIKDLQARVKELEAEMKVLDSESDKITTNIAELENMKLDPVKEHNSKRVAKK